MRANSLRKYERMMDDWDIAGGYLRNAHEGIRKANGKMRQPYFLR